VTASGLEHVWRECAPDVLAALVRRHGDFDTAEDAVQEALLEALAHWSEELPENPKAWLVTVAWRKLVDAQRSQSARRAREEKVYDEPAQGPTEEHDDTLLLLFWCCHPSLSPASAVALTLRAVGGLTTRQIASAYLVPEPTMAQRISRAKRTIAESVSQGALGQPGDLRNVLTVLYLMFNEGYGGEIDLAAEAIRLTRMLARASAEPEVAGLLALMLLHHARRAARWDESGALVPLAEQDRSLWDTTMIREGVEILQAALAVQRLGQRAGEYQAQAAIAALHCDAPSAEETDWTQVLEWYDELLLLTDSKVVRLNRVVAVGEADGPLAGLRELADVPADVPRRTAVEAWLRERAGERALAHDLYARAAAEAGNLAERDHLTRQAARLHHAG
jgi:RNA polymerase sigma factor (sigma-70 family)